MRRVVIASPWRGDTETHHRYLLDCLRDCYRRGEAPIAPHLIGPLVLDEDDPEQRWQGIQAGLAWLRQAHVLAVYGDMGISDGMMEELLHAQQHGVTVEHRSLSAWRRRKTA